MKLTVLALLISIFGAWASPGYSQTARLTLEANNLKMEEFFRKIEDQSEYRFFYSVKINVERYVNGNFENSLISDVLDHVLQNTDIRYEVKGKQIILSPSENPSTTEQKLKSVSGKVTDSSGSTLPGVSVVVKGTTLGVTTDNSGNYSIPNIPANSILQFSFVGMKSKEFTIGDKTIINVTLDDETVGIEEVVAIGYGTIKKSDVTGSVASISSKQLEQSSQTNIGQALQGKIPGMGVSIQSSAAEDGNTQIRIRGVNSISASSDPLIILDGIPYNSPLSEINPNDIKSLEILKDASSSAIYGARAANGVILITTKKGISTEPLVKFEGYYGQDHIAKSPRYFNGEEYYKAVKERVGMPVAITPEEEKNHSEGKSTDWQKLASRNGLRQQYNLSVSGANEKVSYYFSGGWSNTMGTTLGDNFARSNLRINLEGKVTDWLTLGTNTQIGHINRDGVPVDYYYQSISAANSPLTMAYKEDGTLNIFPEPSNGTNSATRNALDATLYENLDIVRSVITNNYLNVIFPKIQGLSYKLNTGYTYRNTESELYQPSTSAAGYSSSGICEINNKNYEDWIIDNILTYFRNFGKHGVNITALYSSQKATDIGHFSKGTGFPNDIQGAYQMRNATVITGTDSYVQKGFISQMGRLNYSFDSKYLLTATIRRDGFSGFGNENKFGLFPSIAIGWNISDEEFMNRFAWVNKTKLRLSYGENGNQAINPYSTMPSLSTNWFLNGSGKALVGYYPSAIGDPTLSWETTRSFNSGLDFSILKGRVSGSFDLFSSKTSDLLLNRIISPVNGASSIKQNIGSTKNFGYEFQITSSNITKKFFSWSTDFNLSFSRNRITDVGLYDKDGNPQSDVGNRWFIGKPLGVVYGYIFDHIMQVGETAPISQPTSKPGYALIVDKDKNDKINADDMDILGYNTPFYYSGMTNILTYKNISLIFMITGQFGKIGGGDGNYWPGGGNTLYKEWWTPINPNVVYPSNNSVSNPYGVNIWDNRNNCDFVKLQEVTLNYIIKKAWTKKINVKQAEIFCNAKNIFTLTDWAWGPDPEFSDQKGNPSIRTTVFGLKVTF